MFASAFLFTSLIYGNMQIGEPCSISRSVDSKDSYGLIKKVVADVKHRFVTKAAVTLHPHYN